MKSKIKDLAADNVLTSALSCFLQKHRRSRLDFALELYEQQEMMAQGRHKEFQECMAELCDTLLWRPTGAFKA